LFDIIKRQDTCGFDGEGRTLKNKPRRTSAFTFLEIMVVVAFLAIIASLIFPRYVVGDGELKTPKKACLQMREIMKALENYQADNGYYPSTEQGLQALVEKPAKEPKPERWKQYLEKVPADPWGNDYRYRSFGSNCGTTCEGSSGKNPGVCSYYELHCYGADGRESDDDIRSRDIREEGGYPVEQ
jgi:general secretion pathway protein G